MSFAATREVLGDGAGEEEDHDDGSSDPEGAVEVWIAIKDVEEWRPWVEGGSTSVKDCAGVDVEVLRVEADGPEAVLGRGG